MKELGDEIGEAAANVERHIGRHRKEVGLLGSAHAEKPGAVISRHQGVEGFQALKVVDDFLQGSSFER